MQKCLRMKHVGNMALWKTDFVDMLTYIGNANAVKLHDVYIISLIDLNTPYARSKVRVKASPAHHRKHAMSKCAEMSIPNITATTQHEGPPEKHSS